MAAKKKTISKPTTAQRARALDVIEQIKRLRESLNRSPLSPAAKAQNEKRIAQLERGVIRAFGPAFL